MHGHSRLHPRHTAAHHDAAYNGSDGGAKRITVGCSISSTDSWTKRRTLLGANGGAKYCTDVVADSRTDGFSDSRSDDVADGFTNGGTERFADGFTDGGSDGTDEFTDSGSDHVFCGLRFVPRREFRWLLVSD